MLPALTSASSNPIATAATVQKDLAADLRPGLSVVLYDEEMEVEGIVEFDEEHHVWLGQPNRATRRDLPTPSRNVV